MRNYHQKYNMVAGDFFYNFALRALTPIFVCAHRVALYFFNF